MVAFSGVTFAYAVVRSIPSEECDNDLLNGISGREGLPQLRVLLLFSVVGVRRFWTEPGGS